VSCAAVVLALCALGGAAAAGEPAEKIDELLGRYHDIGEFNGSALVAAGGEVVFEKGYGLANIEWGMPNGPDTKFRLASVTKQFTAMLIMQLVQEGRLDLDASLADLLPYYRKETGSRVTLHQLLNHTSGIPSYTGRPEFWEDAARDPHEVREFVEDFCSGDLEFEPGSEFRYNNSGYFLLGAIIEEATGKPYEQVLGERILQPLGMDSTGYDRHDLIIERRAAGYDRVADGFVNSRYLDMSAPYSAGALYSTVQDMHRWDRALYGESLLSADWKRRMFEPGLGDYAYGWVVRKSPIGPDGETRTVISHGGGIDGFNTLIARVIEDRHLVVLLHNTGGAPLARMQAGIFDLLYGREPELPNPSVATALAPVLAAGGAEAAVAEYRRLKAEQADRYRFGEQDLNEFGYRLLGAGEVDAAIAILELNVEMFPESFNPYDSLAEAYAEAGRNDLAVKNYARSLELNPENVNAVRQLMRLTGVEP
jgi:CubicO group peptidase (beta-lactamase class C family)